MAEVIRDNVRLYWEESGRADGPPLLLLNSIGTDLHLWDAALPGLTDFRLIRMDTRGHGRSDAPSGDYSLESLAADVLAVLDAANIARVAVAGVSLGGMIAMKLALDHPERISALIPICTSATMDRTAWSARVDAVRTGGVAAIVELAMGRFLSPDFTAANAEIAGRIADGLRTMSSDGYAGCAAAIRDMDVAQHLARISIPTLVIAGDRDTSTPFIGHGEHIVSAIPGAKLVELHSAHLAPIEAPAELGAAITTFL